MADLGAIGYAVSGRTPVYSLGTTPDAWPGVGRASPSSVVNSFAPALDTAGVTSTTVVPAPAGSRVLLLDQTHLRRIALADSGGATFYDVDPGTYIALRAESGQTWSVEIADDGSSVVAELTGGDVGLYLQDGQLKASAASPDGARWIALAGDTDILLIS